MTSQRRTLSYRLVLALTAGFAASLLTTGCGLGTVATGSSESFTAAPIAGQIKGGPNPIAGASISVWVSGNVAGTAQSPTVSSQGYGVGTLMQTVTSGSDGSFSFTGGYPCPSGQFLYLTSAGGNSGAGTNNAAVLVAALGRCDDLYAGGKYTGPFIYMNELTTVAAAFALNGFATTSGNGPTATVGIGAPATNNAAVGSSTAAAGLRHAFLNAANLVNINQPSSSANFRVPSNGAAIVPVQLINSIADSLVACVNTNSTSSTPCATVFGATGTPTTSNTFQAMLNLAKNPTLAGSGYTTAQFLNAAGPTTNFYQPVLTSAPVDYSIAIQYPKGIGFINGSKQGLQYLTSGALDANDNFYVANTDASTPTKFNLVSFSSNGTIVTFTNDAAGTSPLNGLSTDSAGHLYVVDAPNSRIYRYSVDNTGGAINPTPVSTITSLSGTPVFTAVDRANNLWFSSATVNGNNVGQLGFVPVGTNQDSTTYLVNGPGAGVSIDPNQDIWVADTSSSSIAPNRVNVLENVNTAAAPVYNGNGAVSSSLAGESAYGIAFTGSNTNYTGYVTNQISTGGITPVTPTIAGAAILSLAVGTQVTTNFTNPNTVRADGNGTFWISDSTVGLLKLTSGGNAGTVFQPCVPSSPYVNTICYTNNTSSDLAIDSTGTIWQVHAGTGSVTQVIGSAAPTWPGLFVGLLGKP